MRLAPLVALLLAATAAAGQNNVDPLARPGTRLGPGFVLILGVTAGGIDERDLCGRFALDEAGNLRLVLGHQPLDPIRLSGLTVAQARDRIVAAIKGFYRADLEVRASIAQIPRMQVVTEGATLRTGPLTLPFGARLSDALAETGYAATADLERVRIRRIEPHNARSYLVANFARALREGADDRLCDPPLRQGDLITIDEMPSPFVVQTVGVFGEVKRPGYYPYGPDMRVRDALQSAYGLQPSADITRVTILRARDRTSTVVNAERAMRGEPVDNVPLRVDDVVTVATRDAGRRIAVLGDVVSPVALDYKAGMTLKDAIVAAGGFRPDADRGRLVLIRNMLGDPVQAAPVTLDYNRIARGEAPDVPLDPGDAIQVPQRRKAGFPFLQLGISVLRLLLF